MMTKRTKLQKIEVVNKFTGAVKIVEVQPARAFEALNHYRSLWQVKSARILVG